jgi:hypothetical protein
MDPVTLGLCSQIDLDFEVQRSAKDRPAQAAEGPTLLAPEVSLLPEPEPESAGFRDFEPSSREREEPAIDVNSVFAKLKGLKRTGDEDEDDV